MLPLTISQDLLISSSFYTRACVVKKFGLDDLFVAIAFLLDGAQTVGILLQVENGRGRHVNTVGLRQFNRMLLVRNFLLSIMIHY